MLKLKVVNEALSDYNLQSLKGVGLDGDLEIEMDDSCSSYHLLTRSLTQEMTRLDLKLFNLFKSYGISGRFLNAIEA